MLLKPKAGLKRLEKVRLSNVSKRIAAYSLGILVLIVSRLVWLDAQFMGFPDGYLTELQMAQRHLYRIFSLVTVLWSPYFLYLGWTLHKRRTSRNLFIALLLYLVLVALAAGIDYSLSLHFENGIAKNVVDACFSNHADCSRFGYRAGELSYF